MIPKIQTMILFVMFATALARALTHFVTITPAKLKKRMKIIVKIAKRIRSQFSPSCLIYTWNPSIYGNP